MATKNKWVKHFGRQDAIERPGSYSPKHIHIMWQRKMEAAKGAEKNWKRSLKAALKCEEAVRKQYASFNKRKHDKN